jgi:DNA polymerase-1
MGGPERVKELVGIDADGIQMRIFAHYVNDNRLSEALESGRKENESDIHSVNRRALGEICRSRDDAKTFIYAWLLGAGTGKVAEILQCSFSEAKNAIDSFLAAFPGLGELKKNRIPDDAARGYFIGLDGRLVKCDSEHLMLSGYLQNGEKWIVSRGLLSGIKTLQDSGVPFTVRNFVHDEIQCETEDNDDISRLVAMAFVDGITAQAKELKMNCQLAANYRWGYTWKETH